MDYLELIDPELRKTAKFFPFNKFVITVGNVYQQSGKGETGKRDTKAGS